MGQSETGFDLSSTIVHLGLGATATPVADLAWTPEWLEAYGTRFANDGDEGRLVCITPQDATWTTWSATPPGKRWWCWARRASRHHPGA